MNFLACHSERSEESLSRSEELLLSVARRFPFAAQGFGKTLGVIGAREDIE